MRTPNFKLQDVTTTFIDEKAVFSMLTVVCDRRCLEIQVPKCVCKLIMENPVEEDDINMLN